MRLCVGFVTVSLVWNDKGKSCLLECTDKGWYSIGFLGSHASSHRDEIAYSCDFWGCHEGGDFSLCVTLLFGVR